MKKIKFWKFSPLIGLGLVTTITPILTVSACNNQSFFNIDADGTLQSLTASGKEQKILTIPTYVKKIEKEVFKDCTNLEKVRLRMVSSIGDNAFEGCTHLISIALPYTLKSLGSWAFKGCTGLQTVTFRNGIILDTIPYGVFYGCSSLESIIIPEGVTNFSGECFSGCSKLKSVSLPWTINTLNTKAFYDCTSLVDVNIPPYTSVIAESVFEKCTSLKEIIIPERTTIIQSRAFSGCSSLQTIIIKRSLFLNLGSWCFDGCPQSATYYVPNEGIKNTLQGNVTGKIVIGSGPSQLI